MAAVFGSGEVNEVIGVTSRRHKRRRRDDVEVGVIGVCYAMP